MRFPEMSGAPGWSQWLAACTLAPHANLGRVLLVQGL